MKNGDKVIYHEGNGSEHTATVIRVVDDNRCSVAFVSKGREREAHMISSTPGITGECWKPVGNTTTTEPPTDPDAPALSPEVTKDTDNSGGGLAEEGGPLAETKPEG